MKFAVLMYTDPAHTEAMSKEARDVVMRKHAALGEELVASGELIGGSGLDAPHETTVLRLGDEGVVADRRPFVTGMVEQLSSYYELECETRERAEEIAARILDDHVTAVEVRHVHDSADRWRA
jgi:hypothetical protein